MTASIPSPTRNPIEPRIVINVFGLFLSADIGFSHERRGQNVSIASPAMLNASAPDIASNNATTVFKASAPISAAPPTVPSAMPSAANTSACTSFAAMMSRGFKGSDFRNCSDFASREKAVQAMLVAVARNIPSPAGMRYSAGPSREGRS